MCTRRIFLPLNILRYEKLHNLLPQASFYEPTYTRLHPDGYLLRLLLCCTVICIDNDIRITSAILPCIRKYRVDTSSSISCHAGRSIAAITSSCNVDHAREIACFNVNSNRVSQNIML